MGTVWVAEHARLPKNFAVKVLNSVSSSDEQLLLRFKREAEIACRLDHPHIVQVVDFDVESGSPFIVMELLKGMSLAERLAHGAMRVEEASVVLRQVVSALEAAHAESVIHRDLTPRNIFLVDEEVATSDGVSFRAKVLDFGISKVLGGSTIRTAESVVMGTPAYMAPEQARGEQSAIGPRTDQFALGVVMYEALCGSRAFEGDSVPSVLYRVVHEEPADLRRVVTRVDLTEAMASAVHRAMAKEPGDRFPSMSDFAAAFLGEPRRAPSGDGTERDALSHRAATMGVLGTVRSDPGALAQPDGSMSPLQTRDASDRASAATRVSPASPLGGADVSNPGSPAAGPGVRPWAWVGAVLLLAAGGYAVTQMSVREGPPAGGAIVELPAPPGRVTPEPRAARHEAEVQAAVVSVADVSPATGGAGDEEADAANETIDVSSATRRDAVAASAPSGRDADAPSAGPRRSVVATKPPKTGRGRASPSAPAATHKLARELLAQASAALRAGKGEVAEHLARKSFTEQRSSGAVEVIVKAKCLQRQAVSAAGWARRLGKRRLRAVRATCRDKYGLSLPL